MSDKVRIHLWGINGDAPRIVDADVPDMPYLMSFVLKEVECYHKRLMRVYLDCDLSPSYRVTIWGNSYRDNDSNNLAKLGWMEWL